MTDPNDGQHEAADNDVHQDSATPLEEAPPSDEPVGHEEHAAAESESDDERPTGPPIEPAAAAELAQEITLVTRALFAQMLPATSRNAIGGLPGHHAPAPGFGGTNASQNTPQVSETPAPSAVPAPPPPLAVPGTTGGVTPGLAGPTPESEAPDLSATEPTRHEDSDAPGIPVPGLGAPGAPPAAPAAATRPTPPTAPSIPVPDLGATPAPADDPGPEDATNDEPEQPAPRPTRRRSLAVLDEVAFLDE